MTFSDLVSMVYLMIDDPSRERFPLEVVELAINEAMLDIALDTQLVRDDVSIQLQEDQHIYSLHDAIAAGGKKALAYPLRVIYDASTNAGLPPVATELFDLAGIDLDTSAWPMYWRPDIFPWGEFALYPIPNADGETLPTLTGNIQIKYVAYPTMMEADGDYPDTLPAQYHEIIAVRAAEAVLETGGEEDLVLAEAFEKDFVGMKSRIVGDQYRGMTHYDAMRPM
jgi:hypothetical protein